MSNVLVPNDARNHDVLFLLAPSSTELRTLRAMTPEAFQLEVERRGVRFVCHGAVITNAGENTAALRLVLQERAR